MNANLNNQLNWTVIFADVGNINLIVHHTKYFSPQNKNVLLSFIETHTNTCRIITKKTL